MQIFVLGAAVMGIAGAMLTTLDGQFTPGSHQPLRFTFPIWAMVIVGGPRHAQNMNLKRDSPGLSGIKWDKWDKWDSAGQRRARPQGRGRGTWGRGRKSMVAHADKITHAVAKRRANNKPTSPCPSPP